MNIKLITILNIIINMNININIKHKYYMNIRITMKTSIIINIKLELNMNVKNQDTYEHRWVIPKENRIYINSILFGHTMYVNHKFSYRKKNVRSYKASFSWTKPGVFPKIFIFEMFAIFLKLKIFECIYIYISIYIHTSIYISMHLFYPLQKQIQFPPTLSFLLKYSVSGNRSLNDSMLLERFASLLLHLLFPLSNTTFSSFYIYFFLFIHLLFPLSTSTFSSFY